MPLAKTQLAAVDRRLAGQHPQQGRLARAVAPGDGHALAALELERDAAQQGLAGHVLGEVGSDEDRHTPMVGCAAMRSGLAALIVLAGARRPRRGGRDGDHDRRRPRAGPVEVRQGLRHQVRAPERQAGAPAHAGLLRRRGRLHARRARDRQARARACRSGRCDRRSQALEDTSRFADALAGRITRPAGLRLLPRLARRTRRSSRTTSRSTRRSSPSPSSGACRSRCRTCAAWCSAPSARASA